MSAEYLEYFQSFWNICDISLLLSFTLYVAFSFMPAFDETIVMKAIQCLVILFTVIKATYFLRIFDGFSFLVQMIGSVFVDLKYFLLFFVIFLSAFSFFLKILLSQSEDYHDLQYPGIEPLAYFMMSLRTAIGDNEMAHYLQHKEAGHLTLVWLVWLMIIVVCNIVFMNFIIAVVNESYENCMTKLNA
jgi:hypothetical protein